MGAGNYIFCNNLDYSVCNLVGAKRRIPLPRLREHQVHDLIERPEEVRCPRDDSQDAAGHLGHVPRFVKRDERVVVAVVPERGEVSQLVVVVVVVVV